MKTNGETLTDAQLVECSSRHCVNRNRPGSGCILLQPHLNVPRSGCPAIRFEPLDGGCGLATLGGGCSSKEGGCSDGGTCQGGTCHRSPLLKGRTL